MTTTITPEALAKIREAVAKKPGRPRAGNDEKIREMLAAGLGPAHAARHFRCSVSRISKIKASMRVDAGRD